MNLKSFKQFIRESNSQTLAIFTGRFQGFNRGHQLMIKDLQTKSDNTVVLIVEGKKTSEDKNLNPFPSSLRKEMIETACPGVRVFVIKIGYIPDALEEFNLLKGVSKVIISSGEDRAEGYRKQFTKAKYDVEFIESERIGGYSGTKVREALKNNDFEEYKKNCAKGLDTEKWFEKLKRIISENS